MSQRKLLVRLLLNSSLGVALIVIWSRFVNLDQVIGILKTVDLKIALFFFGFFVLSGVLRSYRLKLLLGKFKTPYKDLLMLNFLSQFLSFLIPVRAGEISKSVYLTSQHDLPLGRALTLVFIDRFLDFWTILLLITVFLLFIPTNLPAKLGTLIIVLLLVFSLTAVFAVIKRNLLKKIVIFLSMFLVVSNIKKWFISFTHSVIDGFEIFQHNPTQVVIWIGITLLATFSDALAWFFVFSSLSPDFTLGKTILGSSLTALSFIVPAAPGYVGSAEAAGLAVFSGVLGWENNLVSACLVLFHVLTILAILVLGITSLYFLKFNLNLVWKKIRGR